MFTVVIAFNSGWSIIAIARSAATSSPEMEHAVDESNIACLRTATAHIYHIKEKKTILFLL